MSDKDIAEIIHQTIYAAVATADDQGQPWNSPVFVVYDQQLTFYWASAQSSQHSKNIQANGRAFLVIFDSQVPWGEGKGVYFQTTATVVEDPAEIKKACEMRTARGAKVAQNAEDFMGDKPRRIYKAVPQKVWVNHDATHQGYYVDQRRQVSQEKIIAELF
jgi:general stress protein 26